jgi:hypothetical protein
MIVTVSGVNWKKPKLADLSPVNVYRNTDRQAHLAYARSTKYFSDLRVVYEIQSKLRQDNQLPTAPEGTVPESTPQKDPGRTDGTAPATPRQQNRANDVNSQLQVLAADLPVPTGNFCLVLSGKLSGGMFEGRSR